MSNLFQNIINKHGSVAAYSRSIMPDFMDKNTKIWTKGEVKELILKEVGHNIIWPTTYHVLIKTYLESDEIDLGGGMKIARSTEHQLQGQYSSRIGKLIAWGPDAFSDPHRFPSGPPANIGDWVMYRRLENSPFAITDTPCSFVLDDKVMALTDDPTKIDTQNIIGR
jgi:hypothetical protein